MSLIKINNLKYQLDDKGVIYVEDNKLYFTINTKELIDVLYKFLEKINKYIKGDYIFYDGEDPFLNNNFLNENGEVIIYLRPYTYNVKSEYIDEKKIDNVFNQRGNWKKSEGKYVDFLFIQGDKNSRNKNFWEVKSLINNSVDRESINMRDKTKQHESIAPGLREKFLPKSITFELTPKINPEFAKEFIEKNKVVIMKPSDGFGGRDIYVIDNYKQFIKIIKDLKIFKTKDNWSTKKNKFNNFITKINWILEEYILDPHLYKGIKYHFRVYFIISNNGKSFIYNKFRIALADEPYKKSDFTNEKIHNSHFIHIDNPHFIFLDEFISKKNYNSIVEQLIILFGNISNNVKPRCYNKSKYCFEIMAADLMLEKDMTIKFLEINTNPGYNKDQNIASDILENCMYYLIDDILPPKNKDIEPPEDFIPVYKLERNPRGFLKENKDLNFIDELARVWHTEGYGPKSKKDKTGGYYLSCKTGDINKNDFHIHVVGPAGKNHINSWSRKIKERRKWELLDFRLTPKEQAYHIYVKSGYRKHQNCVDYYKKYGKN
jgi:hypothetical protein